MKERRGSQVESEAHISCVQTGANVSELFTEIAKTIPMDAIAPKPAAGAAGKKRQAGQAQDEQRVNLDGQQAKKGGCC